MDMTWQALLQEAAEASFDNTADTLAAAENDGYICADLSLSQVNELGGKILLLPQQAVTLLLSRYCFRLSPEKTEKLFGLENAKGRFRFYRQLLSSSMGLPENCVIADDPLEKACKIAMKDYLHTEFEESSRTHKVRKRFWKTVAVAAVTAALLFTTCMAASAQFRERVVSWMVETFEEFSIFEVHGGERQDLTAYHATYLPDGAVLDDTTEQPELILYEYSVIEEADLRILVSQSDTRVMLDTEDAEVTPFDKGGMTGYFIMKDDVSFVCFERDGCFFAVFGSIDADELWKIAAGIEKK